MKSLAQVASNLNLHRAANVEQHQPEAKQVPLSDEAQWVINYTFKELRGALPAWRNAFKNQSELEQVKESWTKAFLENGINTMQQVECGLAMARKSDSPFFPPVGLFIKWCKPTPENLGLPSVQEAYLESVKNAKYDMTGSSNWIKWNHDAVFVAAKETGFRFLLDESKDSVSMFKRNYEIATRRVMVGEDLEAAIPKALPARATSIPTERTQAKANIAKLKAMLRGAA